MVSIPAAGDAEAEEEEGGGPQAQLQEELRVTRASLAVARTEIELQQVRARPLADVFPRWLGLLTPRALRLQGELAVLGARLDSVEEDNSELRAMVTELKEMVLAQGPSPVLPTAPNPSPTVAQSTGGAASSRQDGGAAGGMSLRVDESARTSTAEEEAALMMTADMSFGATMMDSPVSSPIAGAAGGGVDASLSLDGSVGEGERPWPSQRRGSLESGGGLSPTRRRVCTRTTARTCRSHDLLTCCGSADCTTRLARRA